jgi:hypothetical protein
LKKYRSFEDECRKETYPPIMRTQFYTRKRKSESGPVVLQFSLLVEVPPHCNQDNLTEWVGSFPYLEDDEEPSLSQDGDDAESCKIKSGREGDIKAAQPRFVVCSDLLHRRNVKLKFQINLA